MHKRTRLEKTLGGEKADRPPIALWQHFPGDDQRPSDLAKAIFAFQKQWNFDFVKVTPANTYSVVDYGLKDEWQGSAEGVRGVVNPLVNRSLDWTELRRLDPTRGSLGQAAEALQLLLDNYGEEVPLVHTIHSPLSQAALLAGQDVLLRHLRTQPDRLKTGLNIIADNTLRYVDSLRKLGVAGICYEIDLAAYAIMSGIEYREFGIPYDRKILENLPNQWWFTIVRVGGVDPMLELVSDYPMQVLSWEDRAGGMDLTKGKSNFNGTLCGGLGRWQPMTLGMPGEVRDQAKDALDQMYRLHLILSTSAPLPLTCPRSNIRTARQVVEDMAG